MASPNVVWQKNKVTRDDRIKLFRNNNKVLWFTGLSGSGKSTIASELEKIMYKKGIPCYILDGDNIRHGLNSDLGFSEEDRNENIRRISEVGKLFYDAGINVLICFISPYKKDRDKARKLIGKDFVEIFIDCPIEECEKRDVKGMYKKAREGKIKDFTGISAPYEEPDYPDITLNTDKQSIKECVETIIKYLKN